jgi:hypothetical protein
MSDWAVIFYLGATKPLRRALVGAEKVLGPEHPFTLHIAYFFVNSLPYNSRGCYCEVETLYKRALVGSKKFLRPRHPMTLDIARRFVNFLQARGAYEEAVLLQNRFPA